MARRPKKKPPEMAPAFDAQGFIQHLLSGGEPGVSQGEFDPATWLRKRNFGPPTLGDQGSMQGPPAPQGLPGNDPLESEIARLLHPQQGILDRMGPLPVPAMPRSANERDVGGRSFLSGLTSGFNSGLQRRQQGPPGRLAQLLQIQEQKRYHDAQIGNTQTDNTRQQGDQDLRIKALEATVNDRNVRDSDRDRAAREIGAYRDAMLGQGDRRLGQGDQRITIDVGRLGETTRHNQATEGLAREREARQVRLEQARQSWTPQMNEAYDLERDAIIEKYKREKGFGGQQLDEAIDALQKKYLTAAPAQKRPVMATGNAPAVTPADVKAALAK